MTADLFADTAFLCRGSFAINFLAYIMLIYSVGENNNWGGRPRYTLGAWVHTRCVVVAEYFLLNRTSLAIGDGDFVGLHACAMPTSEGLGCLQFGWISAFVL